ATVFPTSCSCLAYLGDAGAQLVYDLDERWLEADVEIARAWQLDPLGHDDVSRPRAHDVDVVGKKGGFAQVVRDQDDGEAELLPHIAQHAPQLFARERIQRGERLAQHHKPGLLEGPAGGRDAAPPAA